MNVQPEYWLWIEMGLALTVASLGIVAAAILLERWLGSAAWRRALWQASAAGLGLLFVVEVSGLGRGVGQLWVAWLAQPASRESARLGESIGADAERVAESRYVPVGWVREPNGAAASPVRQTGSLPRASAPGDQTDERMPASAVWAEESCASPTARPEDFPGLLPVAREVARGGHEASGEPAAMGLAWQAVGTGREPESSATVGPYGRQVASHPAVISRGVSAGDNADRTGAVQADWRPAVLPASWPAILWMVGTFVIAAYVLMGHVLLWVFRRRGTPLEEPVLLDRVSRLARHLGVARPVRVIQSDWLTTPVAFGMWVPTVALPPGFADDFEPHEQEAMLVHELAHLSAGDPAWHLAVDLLSALIWWQPGVWLLRRRLRGASEAAADEASLVVPEGPQHLACCLVALGRRLTEAPRLGWISMTGDGYRSNLGRRVARLLALEPRTWRAPRRRLAVLLKSVMVMVLVVAMVFSTAWVRPRAALAEGESTMMQLKVTWSRSLAAAALAVLLGTVSGDAAADQPQLQDESLTGTLLAQRGDGEGERREGEARREGDREEGEGEARREGEREKGEGEREVRREGERERGEGEARREGERERGEGEREVRREGERERGEGEREVRREGEREGEGERGREGGEQAEREEAVRRMARQREELMQHGRELQQALENARREGNEGAVREISEKLEQMKRQFQAVERELQGMRERAGRGEPPRPEGGPRGEMERRLHHLRAAAENLRAAGMHDQAEQLMRQAEGLLRELGPGERPRGEGDVDRPRPERPDQPRPENLEGAVRELHRQMQEMRGQMEEMRNALRQLMERERAGDR